MINVQKHIKKIMTIKDRGKREVALRKLAVKLGCSPSSTYTSDPMESILKKKLLEEFRKQQEVGVNRAYGG